MSVISSLISIVASAVEIDRQQAPTILTSFIGSVSETIWPCRARVSVSETSSSILFNERSTGAMWTLSHSSFNNSVRPCATSSGFRMSCEITLANSSSCSFLLRSCRSRLTRSVVSRVSPIIRVGSPPENTGVRVVSQHRAPDLTGSSSSYRIDSPPLIQR